MTNLKRWKISQIEQLLLSNSCPGILGLSKASVFGLAERYLIAERLDLKNMRLDFKKLFLN